MLKQLIDNYLLRNRYTLLATVLAAGILVIVIEGEITDREPQPYVFQNPYFDLDIADPAARGIEEDDDVTEDSAVNIRRLLWGR